MYFDQSVTQAWKLPALRAKLFSNTKQERKLTKETTMQRNGSV